MSHVVAGTTEIHDLNALRDACVRLGTLEFMEGQQTYRWYGQHVGDYALPAGFTAEQMGCCEHAIRVHGNDRAYEVGVVSNPNGQGWTLLYDFWNGGCGLMNEISFDGETPGKLMQQYGVASALRTAWANGMSAQEHVLADGSIYLAIE